MYDFSPSLFQQLLGQMNLDIKDNNIKASIIDKSTNTTLNLNITVNGDIHFHGTPEQIKDKSIKIIGSAVKDEPREMAKVFSIYTGSTIALATTRIAINDMLRESVLEELRRDKPKPVVTPTVISTDIRKIIEYDVYPFIDLGDTPGIAAEWGKDD